MRFESGIGLSLAALGLGLALWGIGQDPLWLDEAYSVHRAAPGEPLAQVVSRVLVYDNHPPLYYLCLNLWARIWGTQAGALRGLSALACCVVVWLIFRSSSKLLDRPGALLVTAMLATSAYQSYFAQEARHYLWVQMLLVSSFYGYQRALSDAPEKLATWVSFHATTLALALYTFYYSLFFAAPLAGVGLIMLGLKSIDSETRRRLRWMIGSQIIVGLTFLPWVQVMVRRALRLQSLRPQTGWTFPYELTTVPDAIRTFLVGAPSISPQIDLAIGGCGLVLIIAGTLAIIRTRKPSLWLPFLAALAGPWIALIFLPIRVHQFDPKHLIFTAPFAFLALGGIVQWRRSARGTSQVFFAVILAVLILGANARSRWIEHRTPKEDWSAALEFIDTDQPPPQLIVADPERLDLVIQSNWPYGSTPLVVGPGGTDPKWDINLPAARTVWLIQTWENPRTVPTGIAREVLESRGFREGTTSRFAGSLSTIEVTRYDRR